MFISKTFKKLNFKYSFLKIHRMRLLMQSRSDYPFGMSVRSAVHHLRLGEVHVSWSTLPSSSDAQGRARAGGTSAFKRAATRGEFTHHSTPAPPALRDSQHSVSWHPEASGHAAESAIQRRSEPAQHWRHSPPSATPCCTLLRTRRRLHPARILSLNIRPEPTSLRLTRSP